MKLLRPTPGSRVFSTEGLLQKKAFCFKRTYFGRPTEFFAARRSADITKHADLRFVSAMRGIGATILPASRCGGK